MAERVKVCELNDIDKGESQVFRTPLGQIALFRSRKDQWFATAARCPHMGGPIAHAIFDGECHLTCPLHGYTFNVETGVCTDDTLGRKLKTFQVYLEAGAVYVGKAEREQSSIVCA